MCSTSPQRCGKVFAAHTGISEEKHRLQLLPKMLLRFAELLNPWFLASRYYTSLNCHPKGTTDVQQTDTNDQVTPWTVLVSFLPLMTTNLAVFFLDLLTLTDSISVTVPLPVIFPLILLSPTLWTFSTLKDFFKSLDQSCAAELHQSWAGVVKTTRPRRGRGGSSRGYSKNRFYGNSNSMAGLDTWSRIDCTVAWLQPTLQQCVS